MKVKCKICGLKGYWDSSQISEFWASRFLFISKGFFNKQDKSFFICRNCICSILDSIRMEQHSIDDLHKPQIESKEKEK